MACVNRGVTAWQGNGMGAVWARHAMCESALSELFKLLETIVEHKVKTLEFACTI
jgi:hypothetical protein